MKNTCLVLILLYTTFATSQNPTPFITLNQLGFYPTAPKEAVILLPLHTQNI